MAIPEGEDGQTPSQQQQQLTPPSLKTDRPIQLRVVSQHAYVWDIEGQPGLLLCYFAQSHQLNLMIQT
jgi:hypothetical protein